VTCSPHCKCPCPPRALTHAHLLPSPCLLMRFRLEGWYVLPRAQSRAPPPCSSSAAGAVAPEHCCWGWGRGWGWGGDALLRLWGRGGAATGEARRAATALSSCLWMAERWWEEGVGCARCCRSVASQAMLLGV